MLIRRLILVINLLKLKTTFVHLFKPLDKFFKITMSPVKVAFDLNIKSTGILDESEALYE